MIGRPIWEFVSPEEREISREAVRRKISEEQPLAPFQRPYTRRDGSQLVLEIHESLIRDTNGAVVGIRSALLDVTERKRMEEVLARTTRELARSNAELEQFASIASHDLQEPLRKIQAFGDRLRTECGERIGERGNDYLARMQNAAKRMQTLINDLLTFSRVNIRGQPHVAVKLAEVAREVSSDLETRIEHLGARVEVGSLPIIQADPLQMRQLLQNLVGNALKFHRKEEAPVVKISGQLLIESQERPQDANGSAESCQITVEDNGIGFDEKYLDRIFQVFQRLNPRGEYEGTGVGLAICRRIVEYHGGSITARSTPGQGATFIVTLRVNGPLKGSGNENE
jgi:light-regulated signal transduction histidine kinase (bacteriophytochrome)